MGEVDLVTGGGKLLGKVFYKVLSVYTERVIMVGNLCNLMDE